MFPPLHGNASWHHGFWFWYRDCIKIGGIPPPGHNLRSAIPCHRDRQYILSFGPLVVVPPSIAPPPTVPRQDQCAISTTTVGTSIYGSIFSSTSFGSTTARSAVVPRQAVPQLEPSPVVRPVDCVRQYHVTTAASTLDEPLEAAQLVAVPLLRVPRRVPPMVVRPPMVPGLDRDPWYHTNITGNALLGHHQTPFLSPPITPPTSSEVSSYCSSFFSTR